MALSLNTADTTKTHRFHVEIDEGVRKQRLLTEYRLRGAGPDAALDVYLTRRADEFPVIEELAGAARRVSLSSVCGYTDTPAARMPKTI